MNIQLKQLQLINFKGVKQLTVDFEHQTTISGDNGTGKSTIFDAFVWLIFGKDSHDSANFGIKTIENGKVIPMIEHTVHGLLVVDNEEVRLTRTFAEKWTRRRGSEETEMTGHETTFFWNGVPQQAGEYKAKVDAMVSEGLFKLLTSSTYFNSMKWQNRRNVLIQIAGEVSDADVLAAMDKKQVKVLTDIINSGKPLADFKKELSVRKKELQDKLKAIPTRVDEVKLGMPEAKDWEAIKKSIYDNQVALLEIESTINNQVEAYKVETENQQAIQREIHAIKGQIQQLEFEQRSAQQKEDNARTFKINDLTQKIKNATSENDTHKEKYTRLEQSKKTTEELLVALRDKWHKTADEVLEFPEGSFVCPTCQRDLDPDTIATKRDIMFADFEKAKGIRLTSIKAEGERLKALLATIATDMKEADKAMVDSSDAGRKLAEELETVKAYDHIMPVAFESPEEAAMLAKIDKLELSLLEAPKLDIEGLKQQKGNVQLGIEEGKRLLATEEQIKAGNSRIKELLKQEKEMAQQLADLEKAEFSIDAYTRSRMDEVEKKVNERFKLVTFRMFNTLINGGIEECCDTLVNGIPYNDVNSAGKIQAGLDIINTLGAHYGHSMPCFIDNRETVNVIPEMNCQTINLVVTTDPQLVIK